MILPVVLISLALLYLPLAARPVGRRIDAERWYRGASMSLITGGVGLYVSIVSLALVEIFRFLGAEDLARVCDELLGHLPHAGSVVGWMAAAGAAWMTAAAWSTVRSDARVLDSLYVESGIGRHVPLGEFDLIVLPTDEHVAYSRAGVPRQIVISEGTIGALTDPEVDVLVRHERAHLERGHGAVLRGISVVRSVYRWLPGMPAAVAIARLAIERDADEAAAGPKPERRMAMAAALESLSLPATPDVLLAFAGSEALDERIASMRGEVLPLSPIHGSLLGAALAVLPFGPAPILALPVLFVVGACSA